MKDFAAILIGAVVLGSIWPNGGFVGRAHKYFDDRFAQINTKLDLIQATASDARFEARLAELNTLDLINKRDGTLGTSPLNRK